VTYTDYVQRAIDTVQALKTLQQLVKKKLLAKLELLFDPCFGACHQNNNNSGNRGFPMGPRPQGIGLLSTTYPMPPGG